MNTEKVKETAIAQAALLGVGAGIGALTKHAIKPRPGAHGALVSQVGSTIGAAMRNGAGLGGSLAAGAAVVTAKLGVVAVIGVAAAPYLAAAGAGYGIYRLWKKL